MSQSNTETEKQIEVQLQLNEEATSNFNPEHYLFNQSYRDQLTEDQLKTALELAKQDNIAAQILLALCFIDDLIKPTAVENAPQQERKEYGKNIILNLAKEGHFLAQFKLAVCFLEGSDGFQQDIDMAVKMFTQADAKNFAQASFSLGYLYQRGYGNKNDKIFIEPNFSLAIHFLKRAQSLGYKNNSIDYMLGMIYWEGDKNVAKDFKLGLEAMTIAAVNGSASAKKLVGLCYVLGHGVKQDVKLGLELLNQAGKLGDYQAYKNLAELYNEGKCVDRDLKIGKEYYQLYLKCEAHHDMNEMAREMNDLDFIKEASKIQPTETAVLVFSANSTEVPSAKRQRTESSSTTEELEKENGHDTKRRKQGHLKI